MIVVAIIALLAAIAVPAFMRARQHAQTAKFMNTLRIATSAIEQYAMEHQKYPSDVGPRVLPPGMANYMDETTDWTAPTPIGGNWDWDFNRSSVKAAVCVVNPTISTEQLEDIDSKIDDGDLNTGHFRISAPRRYSDIVEE